MVRRRRDQADAGDGVADAGDDVIHFVAGKLAAFAGLGALRHFDLQLVGIDQVVGGDAEAAGGHLLDGAERRPVADSGLRLPRLRRCWICRRCGSWRWRGSRGLPSKWSRSDMAPVAKRLTISLAGSTSSSGMGWSAVLISSRPRRVQSWRFCVVDEVACIPGRSAELSLLHGVLQLGDGVGVVQVIFAVGAELVVAADGRVRCRSR